MVEVSSRNHSSILHLTSEVESMSVSEQSALNEILSCWKSALHHLNWDEDMASILEIRLIPLN